VWCQFLRWWWGVCGASPCAGGEGCVVLVPVLVVRGVCSASPCAGGELCVVLVPVLEVRGVWCQSLC